jgi:predicted lipid-binding transport protein (Tim44 family)
MAVLFGFVALALPAGVIALLVRAIRRKQPTQWSTAATSHVPPGPSSPAAIRRSLAEIRAWDPDFSVSLWEDFAQALYAEAHRLRGEGRLGLLAPYLTKPAREALEKIGANPVTAIVVGAMRPVAFSPGGAPGQRTRLTVELEACYTERVRDEERSYYVVERWTFVRAPTARSRPPERVRVFACPNCGAPLERVVGSSCKHCNRVVDGGDFDWLVERLVPMERKRRPPVLTGTTPEQGNDRPTIVDPGLRDALDAIHRRDPDFRYPALQARVELIFGSLQRAWSTLAWEEARPYLTDSLHQSMSYWIRAYREQGLRNVTERAQIVRLEPARVVSDRWFDAVTVRIFATGLDYTVQTANGAAVVGGSRDRERAYTEYWTLVRGVARKGATRTSAECPQCGAPLQIDATALCRYCGVKVNSGEFDWVLSRIEQDDVYEG